MVNSVRRITVWRKPNSFDWDFYVSEDEQEAQTVITNIKKQNVIQFSTYVLGEKIDSLSCKF